MWPLRSAVCVLAKLTWLGPRGTLRLPRLREVAHEATAAAALAAAAAGGDAAVARRRRRASDPWRRRASSVADRAAAGLHGHPEARAAHDLVAHHRDSELRTAHRARDQHEPQLLRGGNQVTKETNQEFFLRSHMTAPGRKRKSVGESTSLPQAGQAKAGSPCYSPCQDRFGSKKGKSKRGRESVLHRRQAGFHCLSPCQVSSRRACAEEGALRLVDGGVGHAAADALAQLAAGLAPPVVAAAHVRE
eukprot:scaffold72688_cov52-Phaeocystis_antarctica.AAC.2